MLCRGVVLEKSQFVGNRGNGVWFDIGNEKCIVRNCLIADNEDAGIFYEISYGLHAHDNVIIGNGFAETPGAWGPAAGISLSSSPDCLIERNLIVGNREGFNFREQDRTTQRIDDEKETMVWNHDESIRHNVLALNRDAQVWGWFDVEDDRHWPAAMHEAGEKQRQAADLARYGQGQRAGTEPGDAGTHASRTTSTTRDPGKGSSTGASIGGRHKEYAKLSDVQGGTEARSRKPGHGIPRRERFGRVTSAPGRQPGVEAGLLSERRRSRRAARALTRSLKPLSQHSPSFSGYRPHRDRLLPRRPQSQPFAHSGDPSQEKRFQKQHREQRRPEHG